MKKVVEFDEHCPRCNGTGLYSGMAEHDGAAVVCHTCKGTGCHKFRHEYDEFAGRVDRAEVKRVYQTNPGIVIGCGRGHKLEDFGGITLEAWKSGAHFTAGTENRAFTCPCWWYQSADYKLKPDWKECNESLGGSFSDCPHFNDKSKCWERFDQEQKSK